MDTYDNVIPLSQTSFSGKLPRKPRNRDVRSREYLTDKEVESEIAGLIQWLGYSLSATLR